MKFIQRIKNLLGRKKPGRALQTDPKLAPSHPDFDIHAWLAKRREIRAQNPERLNPCAPTEVGLRLGFSDCVSPEEDAEQKRRSAEWEQQQKDVEPAQTASTGRTS